MTNTAQCSNNHVDNIEKAHMCKARPFDMSYSLE